VNRAEKVEFVTHLRGVLETTNLVVITRQSGLTVSEVTDLRNQMRDAGAAFKVVKNNLARLALEGTRFATLAATLTGPIAIAYSKDPVAAAKVTVEFAEKNDKLSIVAGALGEKILKDTDVKALAKLPSLDQMRAMVMGVISAPARQLVCVLNAPNTQLVRVIGEHSKKSA
jgi:large subunit ribosomal protein L10